MKKQDVELRTGLPTGAGGPKGQENAGTWSLLEQEQEFAVAIPGLPLVPPVSSSASAKSAKSSGS